MKRKGIPDRIVVDNGVEFHTQGFQAACRQLGVEITHSSGDRRWAKGRIERLLKAVEELQTRLPGERDS